MSRISSVADSIRQQVPGFRLIRGYPHHLTWFTGLCVCAVGLLWSGSGWCQQTDGQPATSGMIVAAGFGYQNRDTASIAVKVYDPVTGEILSEDNFDLTIKNEPSHFVQDRIFAGGVGLGATDLSNFVIRVYDANTGLFQWEGQLNLTPMVGAPGGQIVSTVSPRRATVTRIHNVDGAVRQPSFVLRALDSTTGRLVWEDEFSADGGWSGRVNRIADRMGALGGESAVLPRVFEFKIQMFDSQGEGLLWEDHIAPDEVEDKAHDTVDDQAHMLPAWPNQEGQDRTPQGI